MDDSPQSFRPSAALRGCIKGSTLRSRLAYIQKYGGTESLGKVLALLTPAHQKTLTGLILSATWYDFEINVELDRAMVAVLGGGRAALRRMGSQSAADSLATSQRNLVRARDPHGLLKHSAQILHLYYDSGSRTYEQLTATSARLRTSDCKSFSEEDCLTNLGWHETAIAMCGGISPRVSDPLCRARGDKICEYLCEWK